MNNDERNDQLPRFPISIRVDGTAGPGSHVRIGDHDITGSVAEAVTFAHVGELTMVTLKLVCPERCTVEVTDAGVFLETVEGHRFRVLEVLP
jgi:hypothetical protein